MEKGIVFSPNDVEITDEVDYLSIYMVGCIREKERSNQRLTLEIQEI